MLASYIFALNKLDVNFKSLIVTLNAYSYRLTQLDHDFKKAIEDSTYVLPDGIAMVHYLKSKGVFANKISGSQLFFYEMQRMNEIGGRVFFLGSTDVVLQRIIYQASMEFPNVQIQVYSPPFKEEFSDLDNQRMLHAINEFNPEVLFVGMTAPKQEKWAYKHFDQIHATHICCIGAVFDFYAGTIKRPPKWMINLGLEWFGRLLKEPRRMWRRYLISSPIIYRDMFMFKIKELFRLNKTNQST